MLSQPYQHDRETGKHRCVVPGDPSWFGFHCPIGKVLVEADWHTIFGGFRKGKVFSLPDGVIVSDEVDQFRGAVVGNVVVCFLNDVAHAVHAFAAERLPLSDMSVLKSGNS